jgi:hypothetical protein
MPPIYDGTASTYGEPERVSPLALYLSIHYEFRVAILSAILLAEVVLLTALGVL